MGQKILGNDVCGFNLSRKDGVVCAEPERRRGQTAGSILHLLCVTVSFIFKNDTDLEER